MVRGKILVVEDNELYAEILKLYLEKKGHTVYVVRDGESACKEVLEIGPDIILLDIILPGMSGIAVCQRLKSDPDLHTIPIIMLSVKSEAKDVSLAIRAGANEYLTKKTDIESIWAQLDEKIEHHLVEKIG